MKHTIKTATACYTGGGIYIYYGQLENGLYFRACDEFDAIYICNANTSTEEADYCEFYEAYTVEELKGELFKNFWNKMLLHIIDKKTAFDECNNYSTNELKNRIIK